MRDKHELITHHFTSTGAAAKNTHSSWIIQLWLCAFCILALSSLKIVAWKNQIYREIFTRGDSIKQYLIQAKQSALENRWEDTKTNLLLGRVEIRKLKAESLSNTSSWLPGINALTRIGKSGEKIFSGIEAITDSIFPDDGSGKALPRGQVAGDSVRPTIASLHAIAEEAKAATETAKSLLDKIPGKQNIKGAIEKSERATSSTLAITSLLNDIAGRRLNVLLIMQNNNELRPSGGFFGTYGTLVLEKGRVQDLHVSSTYDLDGQLETKLKVQPPLPLLGVNNQWLLRDSNWFANFKESAELAGELGVLAGTTKPDLVIAITPDLVTRLLEITGPLDMPQYGISLTADNFVELAQLQTSLAYDKIENKPKELLSDALPLLVTKILNLDGRNIGKQLQALSQSLLSKDILLYSGIPELQNKIENLGWSGSVKKAERDSLLIIRSNLSGTKTDRYIKQDTILESQIGQDGEIENTLSITLNNPLPKSPNGYNLSFLRILVPPGSQLVSAGGFNPQDLEDARFVLDYPLHPKAQEWENAMVKDLSSGSLIGSEAGKTFFGNWIELEGGETKTVRFTYRPKIVLNKIDRLSLARQIQAGVGESSFRYIINYDGFTAKEIVGSGASKGDRAITWQLPTDRDSVVGAVLVKD